jgi:hypothetical protein
MFYAHIKDSSPEHFKRLTGVSPDTFTLMLEVLEQARSGRGRKPTLGRADQLLIALMYWREYRTQVHIAATYGVSEATVSRLVRQVETVLIADKRFHLPGKKALYQSEGACEVVLIDATECPCERPKKNSGATIPVRRNVTPRKRR